MRRRSDGERWCWSANPGEGVGSDGDFRRGRLESIDDEQGIAQRQTQSAGNSKLIRIHMDRISDKLSTLTILTTGPISRFDRSQGLLKLNFACKYFCHVCSHVGSTIMSLSHSQSAVWGVNTGWLISPEISLLSFWSWRNIPLECSVTLPTFFLSFAANQKLLTVRPQTRAGTVTPINR